MLSSSGSLRIFESPLIKNGFYTVLFGILSAGLSLVGLHDMNLREIPLLICLVHLESIIYVFVLCLFTLFNLPTGIPLWAVYAVHLIPLIVAWVFYKLIDRNKLSHVLLGLSSVAITVAYYLLALLPLVVIAVKTFTGDERGFLTSYLSLLPLSSFEIISSALVVSFYLMQFEIRKALVHSNENLSHEVEKQTFELTSANNELLSLNEELKASNESIQALNENLELMVRERTNKINDQLNQLSKYAHMNSHEVRAPLARMLGLLQLIRHKDTPEDQKAGLIDKLFDASHELDAVIKEMNRLLEKEID